MNKTNNNHAIVMGEVTDPAELAAALARHEKFERNAAWLQEHASEVYPNHRGKYIGIAGEELFVADTPTQAMAKAMAAHPDDEGRFIHYIPKEKIPRIYVHQRRMV